MYFRDEIKGEDAPDDSNQRKEHGDPLECRHFTSMHNHKTYYKNRTSFLREALKIHQGGAP